MSDPSFLEHIGLSIPDLVSGFAGGLVNAFVFKKGEPLAIVGSVVVGALMANYLASTIGHYLGTTGGTSGFITGLAGMGLAQGIVSAAVNWRPMQKGKNDA